MFGMGEQSLPELPDVSELSPRIVRLLGKNPGNFTLQGTNTYLLGTDQNRILLDTGEGKPEYFELLKDYVTKNKITIESIVVTHWHFDHTGGVSQVLSLFPDAKIYKWKDSHDERWEWKSIGLQDGDIIQVLGATIKTIHTPGHASDHVCFLLEEENVLFCGDNVLGHGSTVFEDLSSYLSSLQLMQSLPCQIFYPAHGNIITEPLRKVQEYIDHRMQREVQVVALLKDGLGTAADIVEKLYTGYPEGVRAAAKRGVLQHLDKLEKEGRVERGEEERWILREERSLL
ncbi:hypothetical protein PROFUN_04920 [Planoprotostelium fungivorum]|uniref:Metallo-beta-lactamase domain-containing protein n=1 Tax=Planoprotostelium fungivorum TaxID=1890364 RepID=A0A2P6NFB2_9EUKA|nr:hypothetical protein PROFUN_04920 [Planoprotostelium fungivorum]